MRKHIAASILCGSTGLLVGFLIVVSLLGSKDAGTLAPAPEAAAAVIQSPPTTSTGVIGAVYPLFSTGILWSARVSVSLPPLSNYNPTNRIIVGSQVTSLPTASTEDIGSVVGPMRDYYDRLLLQKGWSIDIKFQADGPGGSLWGFRKGNDILILSYTSTALYQDPNAPKQCPCTLVFTIIGGTLT